MWRKVVFSCVFVCLTVPQITLSHPLYGNKPVKLSNSTAPLIFNSYNNGAKLQNLPGPVDSQLIGKWTSTALKFFDFHRCVESNIASSEDECFRLNQIQRENIRVYFASAGNFNQQFWTITSQEGKPNTYPKKRDPKIVAIFPDSSTPKIDGSHDALIALDPYPNASFGHLVAVFYIDFGIESKKCKENFQIYTTDETCITVAKKPRCPNRLERYTGGGLQPRRCHIDFLPTVYPAERFMTALIPSSSSSSSVSASSRATVSDSNNNPFDDVNGSGSHLTRDLLDCVNLPGFARCPTLRPLDDTRKVLCDASTANSKRCDTSHTGVGTRCKLFQTCDRAVLVGGGWNRLHSDLKSFENILKIQESLSSLGFLPENVKTFYANGKQKRRPNLMSQYLGRNGRSLPLLYDESSFLSSAMKTGLRGHIRTICETRHCADTLYIYLNNPTTIEGDMLLWDVDYNGMVDELEVYTVKEFLSDILGCEARRVIIVADQSNSDILLSNLKESKEHKNVVFYTAGLPNQQTINGEFTELWASHSKSSACMRHIHQNVKNGMQSSIPVDFDSTSGVSSKVSLIGAPCDLIPPVNGRELKSLYEGCQNVPTSVWFSATFDEVGVGNDYDINGGSSGLDESEENLPNGRRT